MAKFKVGDKLKITVSNLCGNWDDLVETHDGGYVVLRSVKDKNGGGTFQYDLFFPDGKQYSDRDNCIQNESHFTYYDVNNKTKIMNITEKFVLALTKEPNKTFRKAGITNGDDMLTDEGTKIFLTWLLHSKYADDFKKEIADELLKDKDSE